MTADKIIFLREKHNLTQSALAKIFGITRSSVNAWEMGISVPSTQYIVELAKFFEVSTDFLLDVKTTATIDISDLNNSDIEVVYQLIQHLKNKNRNSLSHEAHY